VTHTILVVEDEAKIRSLLRGYLERAGYSVLTTGSGAEALSMASAAGPDLIVLDLGLPDVAGETVAREVRRSSATPILILTALTGEDDRIAGLELGADDYVTKPFGVDELNARLQVALRHGAGPAADREGRLTVGLLTLDPGKHEVRVAGRPVDLTPREFEILRVLLANAGRLVTKGRLLRAVWGEAYQGEDSYVYVHVSQIRRKLAAADPDGRLGNWIVTEPGVGYRIRGTEA